MFQTLLDMLLGAVTTGIGTKIISQMVDLKLRIVRGLAVRDIGIHPHQL